ncbi:tetratricopeptide repeat protein [candidate division KSB1 bacterium]|nr:tetratricopeptide repeat protein [candidate division KSB1 bacterium]
MFGGENLSEKELFDLAQVLYGEENIDEAIEPYKKIISDFPDGENRIKAIFMLGFMYANSLQDYTQAEVYYNMVLQEYPDHELTPSARFELDNLGKDISEFESLFQVPPQDTTTKKDDGKN